MTAAIREMTIEDYAASLTLWQGCEGIGLSVSDERPALEEYLRRNPGLSFVALDGDELVGTVLCGHDGRRGFLYHLAVRPDSRRQGIGNLLVERALESLRRQGIIKCHLVVFGTNEKAAGFWARHGWKERIDLRMFSHDL